MMRTTVGGLAAAVMLSVLSGCNPPDVTAEREALPLPLSRSQIIERLTGNTVYRKTWRGLANVQYASRHGDDGTLSAKSWWLGGDDRAKGTWVVHSDDTYCRRWLNHWAKGEEGCFRVFDSPSDGSLIFDHVTGNPGAAPRYTYSVLAGNPYSL